MTELQTITVTENRYNTSLLINYIILATMLIIFPLLALINNDTAALVVGALMLFLAFIILGNTTRGYCFRLLNTVFGEPEWVLEDVDRNELAENGKVTIER